MASKLSWAVSLATTLTLAGCVSIPEPAQNAEPDDCGTPSPDADPRCIDTDGDGYLPQGCDTRLPFDCDTEADDIHPGALDDCATEDVDEDCSGTYSMCANQTPGNEVRYDVSTNSLETVNNGVVSLRFDRLKGFTMGSMQNRLAGDVEMLFDGDAQKRRAASSVASVAFNTRSGVTSSLTEMVAGAGVTQFDIAWHDNDALRGATQYTIYPDGRMIRIEYP